MVSKKKEVMKNKKTKKENKSKRKYSKKTNKINNQEGGYESGTGESETTASEFKSERSLNSNLPSVINEINVLSRNSDKSANNNLSNLLNAEEEINIHHPRYAVNAKNIAKQQNKSSVYTAEVIDVNSKNRSIPIANVASLPSGTISNPGTSTIQGFENNSNLNNNSSSLPSLQSLSPTNIIQEHEQELAQQQQQIAQQQLERQQELARQQQQELAQQKEELEQQQEFTQQQQRLLEEKRNQELMNIIRKEQQSNTSNTSNTSSTISSVPTAQIIQTKKEEDDDDSGVTSKHVATMAASIVGLVMGIGITVSQSNEENKKNK